MQFVRDRGMELIERWIRRRVKIINNPLMAQSEMGNLKRLANTITLEQQHRIWKVFRVWEDMQKTERKYNV